MNKADTFCAPYQVMTGRRCDYGKVYGVDRLLLRKFMRAIGDPPIRASLWDGQAVVNPDSAEVVGMTVHGRTTLWRLLGNPLLNFGDDYSAGRITIEGGLVAFLETIYRGMSNGAGAVYRSKQNDTNTISGSRDNIHNHYDIGNDFYKLWLDKDMVYTCGYFPHGSATLETAQIAKMELICRKLRLQPGQHVVEAGCGWGALARYMAKKYGVTVRAFNISSEQIAYARNRAAAEGLAGQIEYVEDDYRNISGRYDAFVSVGMLEHVGTDHYYELGEVVDRSLKDEGLGLIHSIGQNTPEPMSPWLLKRIFPGSYPPTLREMMEIFEPWNLSVLDVENLRLHYARTLEHWLERFEKNSDKINVMFDDCFVRAWRLYLAGAIANFNIGNLQLFQVVFSRARNNNIPLTRTHLHAAAAEA